MCVVRGYIRKAAVEFAKKDYQKSIDTLMEAQQHDTDGKCAREIQQQLAKAYSAMNPMNGAASGESQEEVLKRAAQDPEVQVSSRYIGANFGRFLISTLFYTAYLDGSSNAANPPTNAAGSQGCTGTSQEPSSCCQHSQTHERRYFTSSLIKFLYNHFSTFLSCSFNLKYKSHVSFRRAGPRS